jgi:pimeloyl-ACP methyl ester carboxylesterase
MKPRFRIAGWGVALLMAAGALVFPASTASAATIECKKPGRSENPIGEVTQGAIPVVLVHGWDDESKRMAPVKEGLKARLGNDVTLLRFDYKEEGYHWAAHPNIASCLADYIHKVSKARVKVGGDPRVLVVTHSMGGLAARFATSSEFAANPAEEVAGVVNIGAPSLGSPFGNKLPTRVLEIVHDIDAWPLPDPSTDGAACLALHDNDHPLPNGCKPGPYYDKSVPVAQIGGNISVRRKLFGFNLYDIDLGSDGIVGVDSSLGYVGSGPIGEKTPSGSKILQRRIDCTLPVSQVLDVAATLKLRTAPSLSDLAQFVSSVGTTAYSDMAAMDQIGGSYESLLLMQLLMAANLNASCSHLNIVTNDEALDDAANALRVQVSKLQDEARAKARAEAAARAREAMKSYVGDWYRHRTQLTIKSGGTAIETGDVEIRSSQFTAQGDGFQDLPPKLVGTIQYVSDGTEYQIRAGSRIEFEMDTPQTLWVTYGNGTKRLQFCLNGVHVIGSECGA